MSQSRGTSSKNKSSAPPSKRVSSFQITNNTPGQLPVLGKSTGKNGPRSSKGSSAAKQVKEEVRTKPAGPNDKQPKPQYDEAMEKKFDAMLEGDMSDLLPLPRSIVRIFISSTFSDMRAERNALSRDVSPILRSFCSSLDLDLQLVDLRWGLTEDTQNDHSAERLCLQEVKNCQNVSLGPNFISILSERYGFRPLPTEVLCPEFEMLRSIASRQGLDVALLDAWYKRDDNAIPPEFVLQPIRSQFPHFGDYSQGSEDLRQRAMESWQTAFTSMLSIVREAARLLHEEGKLSEEQRHMYFKSVTEFETAKGIFEAPKPSSHCLLYRRKLTGLTDEHLEDKDAHRYISITDSQGKKTVDKNIAALQKASISKIVNILGPQNCKTFNVPWKSGGVDPVGNPEHRSYIKDFSLKLTQDVTNMIMLAKKERSSHIRQREYYCGLDETLHHLHFCKSKCETFCGQEDILQKVKDHILSGQSRQPLTIWAESGAGKTSVMAMVMKKLKSWIKGEYIGMIRFLGTSPSTLNIYDVLFDVCGQIADCTNTIMEPLCYKTMASLIEYIPRFLRSISSTFKDPIIILLDSIDQLSSENDAYSMSWLPTTLPSNVHLILSTLPTEHSILPNIKKRLPESAIYMAVPILPESTGKKIIDKNLKLRHRRITDDQVQFIIETFSYAPSPLYLKLLLDEAVKWSSFTPVSDLKLAGSIRAAINVLFDRLEQKFGEILIRNALGYITVGLNGLSEIELEDALSCDNEVLDEVYRFHDPPVPGMVRIPPVLWARIRYDIKEYLVERMSQNKITMYWYHRQFIMSALVRYVPDKFLEKLHLTLLQIYLAETGVKKNIYLSQRKKDFKDADRQVTPQPTSVTNLRKLKCVTHHLNNAARAVDEETFKGLVYCNIHFLSTKITACSTGEVVKDMNTFLKIRNDKEVETLKTFLESSKNKLKNPLVLARSILVYLRPEKDSIYLKKLVKDANNLLESSKKTLLIPTFPCLASRTPGVVTNTLLDDHQYRCFAVGSESNQIFTAGGNGKVEVWSVKSGHLVKSYDVGFAADELHLAGSGIALLYNKDMKALKAIRSDSGESVLEDIIPKNVLSLTLCSDKLTLYVLAQDKKVSLHQLDLKQGFAKQTILQKMFDFISLETVLSASERYLIIMAECTPEDYQSIKESWKKSGAFASQPHPYRFAAVDLSQGTGNLQHCLRNLSKIPTLGETISAYRGNTMLIAARRHGIFWDIPTGKCDQQMSKGKKLVMVYRPDWTGDSQCKGANTCFVHPPKQQFLAVGSEDGYLIIYGFESGLPVGMKAPPTKHNKEVVSAAVSPNAKVVASVCQEGVVKLWNPGTGLEVVSLQIGGEVRQLTFTPDSKYLLALLIGESSRMLVFQGLWNLIIKTVYSLVLMLLGYFDC
ncbi:NACHT domain- and WD repeat-containing protein 1-like isoform X1 [Haliotis rufescens]|uniref:NACHT domain- and WD repeat-containing protein 1-like isoform X1 n=1 Tax=Haliotis rufescens TaxID=6454 RepID=UPI00201F9040|nr:NACHT domain- and WD repeat-containing protein 1-like isoform X1 [Haliotis rufescens]